MKRNTKTKKTPYKVTIRNQKTGEVRVKEGKWHNDNEKLFKFQWLENNYSCDCNRALFFARIKGEEDPEAPCRGNQYVLERVQFGANVYKVVPGIGTKREKLVPLEEANG